MISIFNESKFFCDLMCRLHASPLAARVVTGDTVAELSGQQVYNHITKIGHILAKRFPIEERQQGQSILLLSQNTYLSFVFSFAAILSGFDVMFAPIHMNKKDLEWCLNFFEGVALAVDLPTENFYEELTLPVLDLGDPAWTLGAQENQACLPLLTLYQNGRQDLPIPAVAELWKGTQPGRFAFVSFGHDGFQKPERLAMDILVSVAQNFLIHLEAPKHMAWHSLEAMPPSNPFVHISLLCVLLKDGVIGFMDHRTSWEGNLNALRPTFFFASSAELHAACQLMEHLSKEPDNLLWVQTQLDKCNQKLSAWKLRIPERTFHLVKRTLRQGSRLLLGKSRINGPFEDLQFVVHGLMPAQQHHVSQMEKFGIPVIETYGTTQAGGLLSANSFSSPHFNTIGAPLPHVSFRLGHHSILEYRTNLSIFESHGKWQETGDVAQMTPFGFAITGRKSHLFTTQRGVVVSPTRLENLLKADPLIEEACVIGDKMPYLSALIVFTPQALEEYKNREKDMKDHVRDLIAAVNESLPRNVTLKKFAILDQPFSRKMGERLSSGEINRIQILQTRAPIIQSLYQPNKGTP